MLMRWCLGVSFVCLLAVTCSARAAEGDVTDGTGEAQIKGGDLVAARQAAIADALKRCIEKVVGIQIQSEFNADQRELVNGNKDQFYSSVRDNLTQKAEGFIQSYDVLKEEQKGDILAVSVRARVFESKIKAKVVELAELIAKAGNPKLMLVIQEVYSDTEGHKNVAPESTVAAYLEKELLARGFELRGGRAARNVADDSIAAYDRWLEDSGGAARMARAEGADILIAGRVEITNKGKIVDTGGLDALKGQTRIEVVSIVRGINAASGEVFSAKPVQMGSVGMDEERALHRALQGRGNNIIKQTFEQLLEDLKDSFRKTAANGQTYVVNLKGVTSYRRFGQPFVERLKSLSGVSAVTQKSFAEGVLVLDVSYKGPLNELQQKIFSVMDKADGFGKLDVEGISGKQISLKL
jgi:hypothetical protein